MKLMQFTVADPDRQIRGWGGGGGGGHSDPEIRGRGRSPKKFFGSKHKGGPPVDLTLPAPCWVTLSCNPEKLIPSYCTPSRGVGL